MQLPPDTRFQIQFRRKNFNEVWGPMVEFVTIKNTQPPAKPSRPLVAAVLGQLVVTWDGKAADGSEYLPDLNRVEVHVGLDASFTPNSNTMVDQFSIAGSQQQRQASDLEYNTTYYVKLVAVNNSDVRSEPSDEAHDTIRRISGIELEDGSINIDKTNFGRLDRLIGQQAIYFQTNAPTATSNPQNPPYWNDLWYDTDDKYRMYRYQHSGGELTQGANESWEAFYKRNQTNDLVWREIPVGTANQAPGARVFYSDTDPAPNASPALVDGDTWYKTGATSGAIVYVRRSNAWTQVQFGLGVLGPGSIVGDNIVGNTITGNKIAANTITSGQIAANTIQASNIQAGAITADKMAANSITAQNAAIANAAIDDAKIANVSAGKLSAGTISANIILSGNIRTGTTGNRVEIGAYGIQLYNGQNTITSWLSAYTGYAIIYGDITARLFRSQGYQSGGNGYIEIGQTGTADPTDEIRMFYGNSVSSVRNPSDIAGAIRFSLSRAFYTSGWGSTSELYMDAFTSPNYFKFWNKSYGSWHSLEDARWALSVNGGLFWAHGTDGNGNFLLRNGNSNGGAVKLVSNANPEHVQVRTAWDGAYGHMKLATLYYSNLQVASNPSLKKNVVTLNVDAYEHLKNTKLRAWDWDATSGYTGSGIGMLTTEVPMLATPPDRKAGLPEDMSYDMNAMVALSIELGKQNRDYIDRLETRITQLESGTMN